MRIRILVVTLSPVEVRQILPWVHSPYVVSWSANDVLLVCGRSDDDETTDPPYEISAHQLELNGKIVHRKPTPAEREAVLAAFEKKHARRPVSVVDVDGRGADDFPVSVRLSEPK